MASVDHRDWSSLPPELLEQIATSIKIQSDYVRFRAVCIPWRSSTPATPTHLPCQLPWLLFPPGPNESGATSNALEVDDDVSRFRANKYHHLRLPELFHDHHNWRCRGSSHGWLFFLDRSLSVVILNPLTGVQLNLPPLSCVDDVNYSPEYSNRPHSSKDKRKEISKFVLSDCPSRNPDFTALAILHREGDLVCYKSGQDNWTLIPGIYAVIEDAVYTAGVVSAVDRRGSIYVCNVSCDPPEVVMEYVPDMPIGGLDYRLCGDTYRLVLVCDELLLVTRFFDRKVMGSYPALISFDRKEMCSYPTLKFEVHRMNLVEKSWERVNNLGDIALFLGGNSCSSAVMASDYPGFQGNSIYFTEDDLDGKLDQGRVVRHDMGIFCLEDGSFQRFLCDLRRRDFSRSIWRTPDYN